MIALVIITYNRSDFLLDLLHEVLTREYRINSIFLINNASVDGTEEKLIDNKIIYKDFQDEDNFVYSSNENNLSYYRLNENIGGAGGFSFGIKKALEAGAEWIWTLDDDCMTNPQALNALLSSPVATREDTGFISSIVRWTDGSLHKMNMHGSPLDFSFLESEEDRYVIPTQEASFVGMLLHRRAIEKAGLPIKEFFIWGDDTEFSLRITQKCGLKGYYIGNSSIEHRTKENLGASVAQLSDETYWKFKYGWRNQVYIRKKYSKGNRFKAQIKGILQIIYFIKKLGLVKNISLKKKSILILSTLSGLWFSPKIERFRQ